MDKQLHGITPGPFDIGKLDTTVSSGNFSEAYIIEPRDLVPFETSWKWQKDWQKTLLIESHLPQAIWLLQHPKCYTLGRGASETNLRFSSAKPPSDLYRIDRGGEVTHHVPGQLVVYLVMDLHRYKTDLNWYLRQLEHCVIEVLNELGLLGETVKGLTGVWLNGCKISSIGIGCRRWITKHGLSLNVDCDLAGFDQIVPCGLSGTCIGSLDTWLPGLKVKDVQPLMRKYLGKRFELQWTEKNSLPQFEDIGR